MNVIETMEKIPDLEESLGGKVTRDTPNIFYSESTIEPQETIYGTGQATQERYFETKEECDKYRAENLKGNASNFFWTVEYFGNIDELPDVIKITLEGTYIRKESYIYSPAFNTLIYNPEPTDGEQMLYLWHAISLSKIYASLENKGVKLEMNYKDRPVVFQKKSS